MTLDEQELLKELQRKMQKEQSAERKKQRRQFRKTLIDEFGHDCEYVKRAVAYYERIEQKRNEKVSKE